jgi:hypothetical protein
MRLGLPFRMGPGACQFAQTVLPLTLSHFAPGWRSAKPGTVGARAVAREGGTQSGNLRAALCRLPDEFAPE